MFELLIVVTLVVLASGACSLVEAVLYSVAPSHIDSLDRAGDPRGPVLRNLRSQVDRPIAAILSLNTIANTGGAALAGAIASSVLGSYWIGYFSAGFTLAILLFAEIIPKTAGVTYARKLAGPIATPLEKLVKIATPVIWVSRFVTKIISSNHEDEHVSDEELLQIVRRGLSTGDLQPHEANVISNVLKLETTTAAQILTPNTVVFTLSASLGVEQAATNEQLLQHSRIPVFDKSPDDIVGIVHRRDILRAAAKDQFELSLDQLMHPVHFVVATVKLDKLLRIFLEQRQHLVIAINEFGNVSGIVTLEDVLEEILGREIIDEFDQIPDLRAFARSQRRFQASAAHPTATQQDKN